MPSSINEKVTGVKDSADGANDIEPGESAWSIKEDELAMQEQPTE